LEMSEPLVAGDLAVLETQVREAVAAHGGVAAAGRGNEREAADREGGFGSGGHREDSRSRPAWFTWPCGWKVGLSRCAGGATTGPGARRRGRAAPTSEAVGARASGRLRTRGSRRWRTRSRPRAARATSVRSGLTRATTARARGRRSSEPAADGPATRPP